MTGMANQAWDNISAGFNKLSSKMSEKCVSSQTKKIRKYGESHYILCEATLCRNIFQEFVFDFPESALSHMPQRYLWCTGVTLTQKFDLIKPDQSDNQQSILI